MNKPNFLVVGAAKSGTSSLYKYLKQHPEVFLPEIKEPLYFIHNVISSFRKNDVAIKHENIVDKLPKTYIQYMDLYNNVEENITAIGDCSATYLYYYKYSIPQIKKYLGNPKIIILLRNPVKKAFSQYKHLKRLGAEPLSFEDGLEKEERRIQKNFSPLYHYKNQGLYFEQVKAFQEAFKEVKVIITEDLEENPKNVVKEILTFLDVDPYYNIDFQEKYNVSRNIPKSFFLKNMVKTKLTMHLIKLLSVLVGQNSINKIKKGYRQYNNLDLCLSLEAELKLIEYFKEDVLKLSEIIDKDLCSWIKQ